MFIRDVADETFDEVHDRQSFFHILFIFVSVIVESNGISIILIDPGCSYDGSAKIAANIFGNYFRITKIRFGIDIEALFMSEVVFHFIEESSTESITEVIVVKVFYMTPEAVITVTAFGKEAVDVGIPFKIPAKSMEDHDIARGEIFGMVKIEKHPGYYAGDGMEKTVQEGTVLEEKVPEIFINGKNAMTVLDIDEFKSHTGGAFHSIFVAAGKHICCRRKGKNGCGSGKEQT